MDGVRRRRSPQLTIVNGETAFPLDRRSQHRQTCGAARHGRILKGRDSGRNEKNFVQGKQLQRFARENQMAVMNRIESATVNADLFAQRDKLIAPQRFIQ
jgi:hypothetical protein